jgi:hypothetical protein
VGSLVPAGSIGALLEAARQGEMVRPWIMSCALVLVAGAAEAWGDRCEAFDAIFDCLAAARHLMPVKPLLLWEELNRIRPLVAQVPRAYPEHLTFARASAEVVES